MSGEINRPATQNHAQQAINESSELTFGEGGFVEVQADAVATYEPQSASFHRKALRLLAAAALTLSLAASGIVFESEAYAANPTNTRADAAGTVELPGTSWLNGEGGYEEDADLVGTDTDFTSPYIAVNPDSDLPVVAAQGLSDELNIFAQNSDSSWTPSEGVDGSDTTY